MNVVFFCVLILNYLQFTEFEKEKTSNIEEETTDGRTDYGPFSDNEEDSLKEPLAAVKQEHNQEHRPKVSG